MGACLSSPSVVDGSVVTGAAPVAAKYLSIVLSNPVAGLDDEFNDWYTHQHIPDVLAIPGIVAATRYRQLARDGEPVWGGFQYMALYEIETNDLRNVFRTLLARMGTAMMPDSPSMERRRAFYDWDVVTPRLVPPGQAVRTVATPVPGIPGRRGCA